MPSWGRLCLWTFLVVVTGPLHAGDWPMWRFDAGRTAASPDELPAQLHLQWTRRFSPREPVWDDPLNRDLMPYDEVFEPLVSGHTLLLGFNDVDKLLALDTRTGRELWSFYADGPIRLPSCVAEGRVYVASDDGYLYCLNLDDGSVLWKYRGGPSERRILGNERLISTWPARGGPVVRDGTVYFAASIWPLMGTFIYALDAASGEVRWVNDETSAAYIHQPHNYPAFAGIAPQGALAATEDRLIVPGGRSVPAVFDRRTGESLYYHLAKYGKFGGSSVFATEDGFFAHERRGVFDRYDLDNGQIQPGIRGTQPVLTDEAIYFAGNEISKRLAKKPQQTVWKIDADATGDLIRAGHRLYAAGAEAITAVQLDAENEPEVAWTIPVDGTVERLVAADDRLFAVTQDGRILAFGERMPQEGPTAIAPETRKAETGEAARREAERIVEATGVKEGYALVFGIGEGDLLRALAARTELHLIGFDPDEELIERLRRELDAEGLYGRRIALLRGDARDFEASPYLASLIVVTAKASTSLEDDSTVRRVYRSLRPYGGVAWIRDAASIAQLAETVKETSLPRSKVIERDGEVLLSRDGPLEGAGTWTHQYGNIANTIKSDDELVKLPLGVLWFGGSSNMDVLPRHGHGPPEQVIGGRLFIEGMETLSARDVYTGRVLWKRTFKGLNKSGIYFDETYEAYRKDNLTLSYNQVHIPGANSRGTNFVATPDRVYLLHESECRVLDAKTGETLKVLSIENYLDANDERDEEWGYIGVYEDRLVAGVGFADFSQQEGLGLGLNKLPGNRSKWRFTDYDKTASRRLVAADRVSGKPHWSLKANWGFIHNSVVAAKGVLYALDKLPPNLEERLKRRGVSSDDKNRLIAVDIDSGKILWRHEENVFGTWLGVSAEHDVLIQSTRPSNDMVRDESGRRIIAYRASTGKVLWDRPIRYGTPPILHGENIITGGRMYDLLTGEPRTRTDPLTGETEPWSFVSTKGCNYPIASENLLTFRSSSAAFFDLLGDGGTGHFGGFKSGCTSNLIAADGVLNAPDYTRTCRCSFQNQTSLALIHMPDLEFWTHDKPEQPDETIRRVGINLGAPGDRRSQSGTLWLDSPAVGGPSPSVTVRVDGQPRYFRNHASRVESGETPWVAASGIEGTERISIRLQGGSQDGGRGIPVAEGDDDVEESPSGDIYSTSSDLELVEDGRPQTVGIRFRKVEIPRGREVKAAYIQFQVDESSTKPTTVTIAAQAANDAPAFTSKRSDLSSRTLTREHVEWEVKPWKKVGEAGPDQRTPNLAPLLQSVINRRGWKAGNAMAFIITGQGERTAESRNGDAEGAPRLIVDLDEPKRANGSERKQSPATPYTVRLHFMEPDTSMKPGERVFDVALQGEPVLEDFDILADADGPLREVVKEFRNVPIVDGLELSLKASGERPAVLSGVEIVAEQ